MSSTPDCVFCQRISGDELIARSEQAVAFHDAYPISLGHALIVPRRHERDYFDLAPEERAALWSLADDVCRRLDHEFGPDAYNIGVNAGQAAGQTIPHAHIHVIPRYRGDVEDPRGGIRKMIPARAAWWEDAENGPPG